jgi:hypothetical protein
METQPLDRTITEESIDYQSGDHERYSDYVNKNKIVESAVMGNAVEALCGKVWIPSRDPQKFPVCPTCQEIYEALKKD